MSNKCICVIVLVTLSTRLILSLNADRSTISYMEAAAEYNRKMKLIEEGHNFTDSEFDIAIDSVSSIKDIVSLDKGKLILDDLFSTTIDVNFVTRVKRPLGYHRELLLNKSRFGVSQSAKIASTEQTTFVKLLQTTTRWTPYPNYDSERERSLQQKCPRRKNLIMRHKQKHMMRMQIKNVSYSEESVPSSCECHAGNWSESYDAWEKWKQKQCKPAFLNYQYGLELDGTRFRKGHEPEWYKDLKKEKSDSADSSLKQSRKIMKGRPKADYKYQHYPGHNDVARPVHEIPFPYPPQQIMGYPPMYYPYAMQPHMAPYQPHYSHPNQHAMDPVAYQKLEELHKEIKELKERTTVSLWEQYLKLKEKFETTQSTIPTVSYNERLVSYRRLEKKEPYFSKFQSNVVQNRPSNNAQNPNQRPRVQFNEQYQRTIQYSDVYRKNYFLQEGEKINEKETFDNHFLRFTRDDIHKNEQYNRYETTRRNDNTQSQPTQQQNKVNDPGKTENKVFVSRGTRYSTRVYQRETRTQGQPYRTRAEGQQRPTPRVAEQHIQDVRWKIQATKNNLHIPFTNTLPPVSPTLTAGGETTTEDAVAEFRKYKAQYEFPDYVAEKRRLMRAKEKEAKRKLYAARGLVYDEEPPRITTRPTTTAMSEFYFKNRMEYFKYMFDDKSLPVDTSTHKPFNNAPTFDCNHEEGQKKYLKWLFDDKSLEIDPMS